MLKKSAFLLVAFLTIISTLLVACQPAATPTTAPTTAPVPTQAPTQPSAPAATATAAPVTITFWAFGSEGAAMTDGTLWADWYNKILKQYEQNHPNVTINFALKGYDASGSTLVVDTAVAAGTPPDIYFDTKFRVKKYQDAKLLQDITPALTTADVATYDPAVLAGSKSGTMLWSIPADGGYWNMIINKSLFEKANLTDLLPKAPDYTWTTDEFIKACKAINNPPNVYCTAFFAGSTSMDSATNAWLAGWPDCKFYDQTNQQYTVNSPACVEAFTFLHSIYDQKLMVPGAAGLIDDTTDPYWLSQKVAMLDQGNWYDSITKKGIAAGTIKPPFDYMFVQVPNKPGTPGSPVGMSNPDVWGVFKQTDPAKLQAIYDLLNYMQKPDIATQIALGWGKTPVRTDTNFTSNDPAIAEPIAAEKKLGSFDPYFVNGVPCGYNDVRQAWADARQAFWQDNANIQSVLDAFVTRANGIITACK
jgi:ABC-type glycerol-3-phosphate transport system substrate-binding protein